MIKFLLYFSFFILTFILIQFFKTLAPKMRLVDNPDKRKLHSGKIPLVGGIAIYLSFAISIFFFNYDYLIKSIIFSSIFVVILGLIDDAFELGIIVRLASQIVATLIVIGTGLSILNFGNYEIIPQFNLGIFSILVTVLAVLALTNAINFVDGIDGLSSGLVLIALITIFIIFQFEDNNFIPDILYVAIFVISSFFIINLGVLPFKRVFLGDSGSMFLGFFLSWLLIYMASPSNIFFHPVLVIWSISVPIFDLLGVITRRILRKSNPFKPDRRHIHHILIDLGLPKHIVLIYIIFFALINSISGLFFYYYFGPTVCLIMYLFYFLLYFFISLKLSRKIIYSVTD